jgi:hypothetical protein
MILFLSVSGHLHSPKQFRDGSALLGAFVIGSPKLELNTGSFLFSLFLLLVY